MGIRMAAESRSWRIAPLLALAAACGGSAGQPGEVVTTIPFDTGTVRIFTSSDTVTLLAEIATTNAQHEVGLMERTVLDPNSGMIFVYPEPQPETAAFWMYRTRIPLDIAFVDSAGRIATILAMTPCESPNPEWCEQYAPGVRYQSALEANLGFFAGHGIAVGDSVLLEPGRKPSRSDRR
jgi:uncharacterized membrane protein (UPF0127 family)